MKTLLFILILAMVLVSPVAGENTMDLVATCRCDVGDCQPYAANVTVIDTNVTVVCEDPSYSTKAFSYNIDEPITYPQEYYTLGKQADSMFATGVEYRTYLAGHASGTSPSERAAYLSAIELRRQTILMERQNELIYEQNMWQRNATLKCIHRGAEDNCLEYAWVGA